MIALNEQEYEKHIWLHEALFA